MISSYMNAKSFLVILLAITGCKNRSEISGLRGSVATTLKLPELGAGVVQATGELKQGKCVEFDRIDLAANNPEGRGDNMSNASLVKSYRTWAELLRTNFDITYESEIEAYLENEKATGAKPSPTDTFAKSMLNMKISQYKPSVVILARYNAAGEAAIEKKDLTAVTLTTTARESLQKSPAEFFSSCGTGYVDTRGRAAVFGAALAFDGFAEGTEKYEAILKEPWRTGEKDPATIIGEISATLQIGSGEIPVQLFAHTRSGTKIDNVRLTTQQFKPRLQAFYDEVSKISAQDFPWFNFDVKRYSDIKIAMPNINPFYGESKYSKLVPLLASRIRDIRETDNAIDFYEKNSSYFEPSDAATRIEQFRDLKRSFTRNLEGCVTNFENCEVLESERDMASPGLSLPRIKKNIKRDPTCECDVMETIPSPPTKSPSPPTASPTTGPATPTPPATPPPPQPKCLVHKLCPVIIK